MSETETRPDGQPERRRVHRAALRLNATIREPGRSRVGVRLIDISTHGCRIEANCSLVPENWLLLSIAGLETQYCRVAWCCDDFSGLEFAAPLAEPVLEKLIQDQQDQSESTIGELHEIAKRTHRLATGRSGEAKETLTELSHKCAVDAVVAALRLGEANDEKPAG